ncbi:hypothetical protein SeMB42_g00419 [Synchytrium endobioticum]|uniref:Uncharacterized protein n=1 Tax=Synchytrium endobioticum TaxID=286115 RepID=A0A507DSH8_9FUNG|nr:hypothetical protein SeMB42_g00419 [Synchytrium endobioticum]
MLIVLKALSFVTSTRQTKFPPKKKNKKLGRRDCGAHHPSTVTNMLTLYILISILLLQSSHAADTELTRKLDVGLETRLFKVVDTVALITYAEYWVGQGFRLSIQPAERSTELITVRSRPVPHVLLHSKERVGILCCCDQSLRQSYTGATSDGAAE